MKKDLMYGNSRGQLQLKKSGVSRGVVSSVQEKLIWNFHRSKFLILEFPRDITQYSRISRSEILFSDGFLKG